jgi:hypothetical protein
MENHEPKTKLKKVKIQDSMVQP